MPLIHTVRGVGYMLTDNPREAAPAPDVSDAGVYRMLAAILTALGFGFHAALVRELDRVRDGKPRGKSARVVKSTLGQGSIFTLTLAQVSDSPQLRQSTPDRERTINVS